MEEAEQGVEMVGEGEAGQLTSDENATRIKK